MRTSTRFTSAAGMKFRSAAALNGVAGRHPAPVEQGQRADRAQVAQLHRRRARRAVGDRGVLRREDLRQLLDQVLDTARPLVGDLLDVDDRDGAESCQVLARNHRARHGDFFRDSVRFRLLLGCLLWCGLLWRGLLLRRDL